jgi:hypothetical protein
MACRVASSSVCFSISLAACSSPNPIDFADIERQARSVPRLCEYKLTPTGIGEGDADHAYVILELRSSRATSPVQVEVLVVRTNQGAWRINEDFAKSAFAEAEKTLCANSIGEQSV